MPTPRMELVIESDNGTPFSYSALPDTGATKTIMHNSIAQSYGIKPKPAGKAFLTLGDDRKILCEGNASISIIYQGARISTTALISSSVKKDIFVGWHDLQALGILSPRFPDRITSQESHFALTDSSLEELFKKFPDVFNEGQLQPMRGPAMQIYLKDDLVKPTRCTTSRTIPLH